MVISWMFFVMRQGKKRNWLYSLKLTYVYLLAKHIYIHVISSDDRLLKMNLNFKILGYFDPMSSFR